MAEVRSSAGVPAAAAFGGLGAPSPGTPIVVNTATGDLYVLINGGVTLAGKAAIVTSVSTTNATTTTIATVTLSSSTTTMIESNVIARRTGGSSGTAEDGAGYIVVGCYKNAAGTVSEIGESSLFSAEDQPAWSCTMTPSGSTVLIQVTGAANNNIDWSCTYRVYTVS